MTLDYHTLEPGLAVSAYPFDGGFQSLSIDAVLNVCDFEEPSYRPLMSPETKLVCRPFEDLWPVPFPWLVTAVLELADLRRQDLATLVHCHAGQHRSPTVIALYWMAREGIDWESAVKRLLDIRPIAHPGRTTGTLFADNTIRERSVAITRQYLNGDHCLLDHYRCRADSLSAAYDGRHPDPSPVDADWNQIDDALAVGVSTDEWPSLAANGFDCILSLNAHAGASGRLFPSNVTACSFDFPVQSGICVSVLSAAVRQLDHWRRQGRRIFLYGPDQDFFAVSALCVWLIQTRKWDAASSIWYVASRRPQICLYLDILLGMNLESLSQDVAQCSESLPHWTTTSTQESTS